MLKKKSDQLRKVTAHDDVVTLVHDSGHSLWGVGGDDCGEMSRMSQCPAKCVLTRHPYTLPHSLKLASDERIRDDIHIGNLAKPFLGVVYGDGRKKK